MADAAPAGEGAPAPTQNSAPAPVKPDYVPDAFWNTQKNEVDVQGLATKYTELSTRFAKGKEAIIPEVKEQLTKELFGKRPEKPDGYKFELPKAGPLLERLGKANLVISDKRDTPVEEGKRLYHVNTEGPLFTKARELAYASGMSNDDFMDLVAFYAETEAQKADEKEKEFAETLKKNRESLGENAEKRIEFVKSKLDATVPEASKHIGFEYLSASGIKAIEALLEKSGAPKFADEGAGSAGGRTDLAELEKEAETLINSWDYAQNNAKNERVSEISRILAAARKKKK